MGIPSEAKSLRFGALVASLLVLSSTAQAATYYVRVTGNDASHGKVPTAAFRTLSKAAQVVANGDLVYVGGGTYAETVEFNGLRSGSQRITFVADVNGTRTGDAGAAVIAGAVHVVNSNNIELNAFTFRGAATRYLIWKDSYEGLLQGCTFVSGDQGLLVKNASLELHACEIKDFAHDGIQVDGTAKMFIHDTKITGCGGSGIEIRKVAKIVLDTCELTGHAGDGVSVAVTADSINDNLIGKGGYQGPAPLAVSDGPVSFGGSSYVHGDFFHREGYTADASHVSGTVGVLSAGSVSPVDPGDAATNNNNANLPKTDKNKTALTGGTFYLASNDGVDLPPGTYFFDSINCKPNSDLRISGPTVIFVSGDVVIKGAVNNATKDPSNLQLYSMGTSVFVTSQSDVHAAIYAPSAVVKLRGGSEIHGMVVAGNLDMSGSSKIHPDPSLTDLALSLITMPPGPPPAPLPIASGILDISGSTVAGNANGVRMITPQAFNSRATDYSHNTNFGLELFGTCQLDNLTINSNDVGGIFLNQTDATALTITALTLTDNTTYGVYADRSDLAFDSTNIGHWIISGSQFGVAAQNCDLTLENVTMNGGSQAAVQLVQGNMKASNATFSGSGYGLAIDDSRVSLMGCTFTGNSVGLLATRNDLLSVVGTRFSGNTLWGASVLPSGTSGETATFSGCTFAANAGGLTVIDATDGDVLLRDATVIRDNTASGLHFDNCELAVTDQAGGANWSTLRNLYGISSNQSTLALTGVAIQDSASYSLLCQDSAVTLTDCQLTGRYAIYADHANDSLTIKASVFKSGATPGWGVVNYGGTLNVTNSTFDGYWLGLYLYSADGTDQATLLNTTIANVTGYGMYIHSGDAEIRNSILTGSGYGLVRIGGATTHTHNLLHGFGTPFYGTSANASELQKDPRFVDAANGDFHLDVGSPAINAGMDVGALVPADIEGNARPSYNGFEMGAFEFMSPNGSLRVLDWAETR